jgi:hypothetical protein
MGLFTLLIALLFVPIASADQPPLTPGLWEVVTNPEFKGIPVTPSPKIDHYCLTEKSIREGRIPLRIAVRCKIMGGQWNTNKLRFSIACEDAPADAQINNQLEAAENTFSSFITLNPSITYQYSGKWLGERCQ